MITLARDGMRSDLERIWRLCFKDSDEHIKYFFDYRYNPNACAIYLDENIGRPVAMLYMLDAFITEDSEIIPTQYIYAPAVRPDYQQNQSEIMTGLLEFARRYAYTKRQKYMIIVPSTRGQYKFYENNYFHRCFYARDVYMTRHDLISLSGYKENTERKFTRANTLSLADINAVRRDILVDREGFVTWDFPAFKYAAGVQECQGGSIVASSDGIDAGYAFCKPLSDGSVMVSEFIAHNGYSAEVIKSILEAYRSGNFILRVPVFDEFFAPFGEINERGMISAVNGRTPVNMLTLKGTHLPYLGLVLD